MEYFNIKVSYKHKIIYTITIFLVVIYALKLWKTIFLSCEYWKQFGLLFIINFLIRQILLMLVNIDMVKKLRLQINFLIFYEYFVLNII